MISVSFVCIYSTSKVRARICRASSSGYRGLLDRIGVKGSSVYDFAPWIPEIVKAFEHDSGYDFHVVCLHPLMRNTVCRYDENGVHYHFLSANLPLGLILMDRAFNFMEKSDYRFFRKRLKKEIELISPSIVCVCGAENPSYSVIALEDFNCPTVVILQTLLNSERRKQFQFGTQYRRDLEKRIFSKVKYYLGYEPEAPAMIRASNREGVLMKFVFPSIQPRIVEGVKKEYDFVFYAGGLSKFKGIEDAIDALAIVKDHHPKVKMDVIGGCGLEYRNFLDSKISQLGLIDNIHFSGFFKEQDSVFLQVQKAHCVLVPGITAPLNSTVREAMFMRLPTITYRTTATDIINEKQSCVITAQMESVEDLGNKMLFVLNAPKTEIDAIAQNGYMYAVNHFSSEAVGNNMKVLLSAVLDDYHHRKTLLNEFIYHVD